LAWLGFVWLGLDWFGVAWHCLNWPGFAWPILVWLGFQKAVLSERVLCQWHIMKEVLQDYIKTGDMAPNSPANMQRGPGTPPLIRSCS